jgi:hypothetical protein
VRIGLQCPLREAQQDATQPVAKPAADDSGGTADLAKATQDPVSSLISVPVQNNDNFGIGPFNRIQRSIAYRMC